MKEMSGTTSGEVAEKPLARSASEPDRPARGVPTPEEIRTARESLRGPWLTDEFLERAINEGRP